MTCGIECVLGKLPDASYVPEENIPMDLEHPVDGRMWLSILVSERNLGVHASRFQIQVHDEFSVAIYAKYHRSSRDGVTVATRGSA